MKKMNSKEKLLLSLSLLASLSLFLYSFTQIDLGLVFSRFPLLYKIESAFQYIGYFNRNLSGILYLLILALFFAVYLFGLQSVKRGVVSSTQLGRIILVTACILALSYTAFSYDIFNYQFDAKIITQYGENPYLKKALDFPGDPMLSFMHWTHRTYPYGPVWLVLTVPLSFIGHNIFIVTYYLFKFLALGAFLGTTYYIYKIKTIIAPTFALLAVAVFALNPFVLSESLVTAHIDIVMMFFAIFSVYLLVIKRFWWAVFFLLLSAGIKFVTILLLPLFLYAGYMQVQKKSMNWNLFIILASLLMTLSCIAISYQLGNFQPWYMLLFLPFTAFLAERNYITFPTIIFSVMGTLYYVPYLLFGNWDPPIPTYLLWLQVGGVSLAFLSGVAIFKTSK